jgi:hypothetical protein
MIKYPLDYKDYDGNMQKVELWFHMTRTDFLLSEETLYDEVLKIGEELEDLAPFLTRISQNSDSTDMQVGQKETEAAIFAKAARLIAKMIDHIVTLAYGVRDGQQFKKNPALTKAFKETAAFSSFMEEMLLSPEKVMVFVKQLTNQLQP